MENSGLQFEAIGTHWNIEASSASREALSRFKSLDDLEETLHARIEAFDKAYSRFRPDSLIAEMSRKAGTYELPDDAKPMLDLYEELYRLTDGRMTPLIGQTISDAGYDAEYSLVEKPMFPPPSWDEALDYEFPRLTLKKPALLDFGALGKGLLIDIIGAMAEEAGFGEFLIDGGGDMLRKSNGSLLRVGLEDPGNEKRVVGVALLSNGALCGSAGNRRAWGRFHHILDPVTLESPRRVLATWTTAPTALLADAMATSLFFVPREKLASRFAFESLVLTSDYAVEASDAFQAELFLH